MPQAAGQRDGAAGAGAGRHLLLRRRVRLLRPRAGCLPRGDHRRRLPDGAVHGAGAHAVLELLRHSILQPRCGPPRLAPLRHRRGGGLAAGGGGVWAGTQAAGGPLAAPTLLPQVPGLETPAGSPLQCVQSLHPQDGPLLHLGRQLRWAAQLQVLPAVPVLHRAVLHHGLRAAAAGVSGVFHLWRGGAGGVRGHGGGGVYSVHHRPGVHGVAGSLCGHALAHGLQQPDDHRDVREGSDASVAL
mmetsp:Transcript_17641/g.45166  ORF Transcript_17641/g.45166 Transcript_17641/m.45166 type:complete len:243 (+) Transcript_17641:258-986(+)